MASEEEEIAALDRVLTRTVLTKDEDLQQLLVKLLPALVQKLSTTSPKIRAKVLELLNHINKRVKALPDTALPLLPLVGLALSPDSGPMVRSFGLVYVEMAQPRAPPQEQLAAVPLLLAGISSRPAQHRAVALRVVTAALSLLQPAPAGGYSQVVAPGSSKSINAPALLPAAAADRQLLLDHALKLMLYQRPTGSRTPLTPLELANAAAAAAAGGAGGTTTAAAAAASPPPAGLSSADVALLEEKGVPSQEVLTQQKLGMLAVLAGAAAAAPGNAAAAAAATAGTTPPSDVKSADSGPSDTMEVDQQQQQQEAPAAATAVAPAGSSSSVYLSSEELLLVLLAASCDPYEAVARRGGDVLAKVVNPDAARPAVDLESPAVVEGLLRLLLGDQYPGAAPPSAAPSPAGPSLAVRIMQLLVRSVSAARTFPAAPVVLSACMYGPASSPRLVRLGAEWAGWMFKHAQQHQLRAMAGPLLARLTAALGLADQGVGGGEARQVDGGPAAAAAAPVGLSSLSGSIEARGHVFSALGQLTQRLPDLFKGDTRLASRLFAVLSVEPPGSRAALQEALGGLAGAMQGGIAAGGSGVGPDKLAELQELLLKSIASNQASVRLCAAQWAARLFPRHHMPSRYICMLAAGDPKPEVREVGLSGLGLATSQLPPNASPSAYRAAVAGLGLPGPGDVIAALLERHKQLGQAADLSRPLPLPDASCRALVAFTRAAVTAAAAAATSAAPAAPAAPAYQPQHPYSPAAHALLLENLACRAAGRETAAAALEGLVELLGAASGQGGASNGSSSKEVQQQLAEVQQRLSGRQSWLGHWLSHHHLPARLAAARLTALAASSSSPAAAQELLQQLQGSFPPLPLTGSSTKLEEQEGAMLATGLLVARAASCGSPQVSQEQQQQVVAALEQQLAHHSSGSGAGRSGGTSGSSAATGRSLTLAGAAALSLGFIGLTGKVDLPNLTGSSSSNSSAAESGGAVGAGDVPGAGSVPGGGGGGGVLGQLLELAGCRDSRAVLRAVAAIGYIAAGSSDAELQLAAAKGLLGVCCVKGVSEEVLLAVGEAAAATAGDIRGLTPHSLLWSNFDSIADCVDAVMGGQDTTTAGTEPPPAAAAAAAAAPQQQQQGGGVPDSMEVDQAAAAAVPSTGNAGSSSSHAAVQEYLLAELTGKMAVASKEEVRCAACLLLVSLLQLCSGSALLASRLPQLQATFTGLLGDSNELTQDLAARGVSLVYSRGGGGLQQQLLGQLLGLLQGGAAGPGGPGGSAAGAAGVKLAADTKVFQEGQLGNTPGGGGLTTYRELCSLANDLGQPDLIYRFMDLARASSALTAKRGAAVGVARIARLAATATGGSEKGGLAALLGPERLAALLPKLYRLTHDPSPKVAESMSAIWCALLDDPRAALEQHFDALAKSLLCDVGARLWRVRQAGCSGLTDLLARRRWTQLEPHMEQLWVMGLRGLDDVKESVRAAAAGLVRSLRGLSLRLMDLAQTPAADVAGCCRVVLPLLSGSQGIGSAVGEVRGVAASVLCGGLKTAGAPQVLPVLPVVVPVLLEALSGMEDTRLNYVEQHAASVGIDAEQLALARLAAARASSLTEALDAAGRALTGPAAVEMAPGLAALIRRGVGLSTKAGSATFIKALAVRLGPDLKPAAPQLLKPLVAAVASESSAAVKRAYAAAAAALAVRCVGDKRRDKFVGDALASYGAVMGTVEPYYPDGSKQQQGSSVGCPAPMSVDEAPSAEEGKRQAGGLLLLALLKESSDTFNSYASQILPVAFLASHDEVPGVASPWSAVWSQGCPSEPAALRMHTQELAGLIAGGLASSSWGKKKGAAEALCVLADTAGQQLSPYSPALGQQLLSEVAGGRLWDGKEVLLAALGKLASACAGTLAQMPGITVVLSGLLSAAARKKTTYRAAALAALQQVLKALQPLTEQPTAAGAGPSAQPPAVDGDAVWDVVAPPLLEALQQHLVAVTKQPESAASNNGGSSAGEGGDAATAGDGGSSCSEDVKPLPLVETCSCTSTTWKLLQPSRRAVAAPLLVPTLVGLMAAAGVAWTSWVAVVDLAQVIMGTGVNATQDTSPTTSGSAPGVAVVDCVPLATGLVHVLHHSTVSQLRMKCLEATLSLLQLVVNDTSGTATFRTTTEGGVSLASNVSNCLSTVSSQDPSVAHKAIAADALALVQQIVGR